MEREYLLKATRYELCLIDWALLRYRAQGATADGLGGRTTAADCDNAGVLATRVRGILKERDEADPPGVQERQDALDDIRDDLNGFVLSVPAGAAGHQAYARALTVYHRSSEPVRRDLARLAGDRAIVAYNAQQAAQAAQDAQDAQDAPEPAQDAQDAPEPDQDAQDAQDGTETGPEVSWGNPGMVQDIARMIRYAVRAELATMAADAVEGAAGRYMDQAADA